MKAELKHDHRMRSPSCGLGLYNWSSYADWVGETRKLYSYIKLARRRRYRAVGIYNCSLNSWNTAFFQLANWASLFRLADIRKS